MGRPVKGRSWGEVDVLPCGPEAGGGAGKFCNRGASLLMLFSWTQSRKLTIRDVGDIIDYLG
jgi:hypothetical protein